MSHNKKMTLPTPSKVVGTYCPLWVGSPRITAIPQDYNWIYLFHAVPSSGGAFKFEYGNAVSSAEIDTCQARGQRVVLTCGGANAGFYFANRTQSTKFVDSFATMYTALGGVDGCDFNNFEAGIGSNPAEMVWISQQLKAAYGPNFSITCPPAPGAGYAPQDRVLTKALADAGVLTFAGPQFYDSPDLTTEEILLELIPEWVTNVGGADKVVIGAGANYSGGATTATTVAAWNQLVATYPSLRGVFGWSTQTDQAASWSFGKTLGPLVVGSPQPSDSLPLHKISETATTVTLGWTPVPCLGYVLYADGKRKSNSWDQSKSSWKTDKATEIKVVALGMVAEGLFTP